MANVHNLSTVSATSGDPEDNAEDIGLRIEHRRGATVVTVSGELDASNIHHLSDCTHRFASGDRPFVLDLSELDFLAAQGMRVLFGLDEECEQTRVKWALVPGRPVARLLRICDRDGRLPTVLSIDQALQGFSGHGHGRQQLLQLVP